MWRMVILAQPWGALEVLAGWRFNWSNRICECDCDFTFMGGEEFVFDIHNSVMGHGHTRCFPISTHSWQLEDLAWLLSIHVWIFTSSMVFCILWCITSLVLYAIWEYWTLFYGIYDSIFTTLERCLLGIFLVARTILFRNSWFLLHELSFSYGNE